MLEFNGMTEKLEDKADELNIISTRLKSLTECIKRGENVNSTFMEAFEEIHAVLELWVGATYVGEQKSNLVESMFQSFFLALDALLYEMLSSRIGAYRIFAEGALYNGTLYRVIGHSRHEDMQKDLKLLYSDVYVSWSTEEVSSYLESKLYGNFMRVVCNVAHPMHGILLEPFGVHTAHEHEVVFPTVKETIVSVKMFDEDGVECDN